MHWHLFLFEQELVAGCSEQQIPPEPQDTTGPLDPCCSSLPQVNLGSQCGNSRSCRTQCQMPGVHKHKLQVWFRLFLQCLQLSEAAMQFHLLGARKQQLEMHNAADKLIILFLVFLSCRRSACPNHWEC